MSIRSGFLRTCRALYSATNSFPKPILSAVGAPGAVKKPNALTKPLPVFPTLSRFVAPPQNSRFEVPNKAWYSIRAKKAAWYRVMAKNNWYQIMAKKSWNRILARKAWNHIMLKTMQIWKKPRLGNKRSLLPYIQLQTRRKLAVFYGNISMAPLKGRRRNKRRTRPFLLDLERRLDVILLRSHLCQSLPQARQLISHKRVCVNKKVITITKTKVWPGDIISLQKKEEGTRRKDIERAFYFSVNPKIGRRKDQPKKEILAIMEDSLARKARRDSA